MANNLYDVEIKEVDEIGKRVKIHFKGFSEKYDEWRPFNENNLPVIPVRVERMSQPTHVSLEERIQCFHERLKREIKRKLFSWSKNDPEVWIEIAVHGDVFNEGIGVLLPCP